MLKTIQEFHDVFEIWDRARDGVGAPRRDQLRLTGLSLHAQNVCLFKLVKGRYELIYFGAGSLERVGHENTGKDLLIEFPQEIGARFWAAQNRIVSDQCASVQLWYGRDDADHTTAFSAFTLPFLPDKHAPDSVLSLSLPLSHTPTYGIFNSCTRMDIAFIDTGRGIPDDPVRHECRGSLADHP